MPGLQDAQRRVAIIVSNPPDEQLMTGARPNTSQDKISIVWSQLEMHSDTWTEVSLVDKQPLWNES